MGDLQARVQQAIDAMVESGAGRGVEAMTKNRLTQDFNAVTEISRLMMNTLSAG
jgi:hypothetical protein